MQLVRRQMVRPAIIRVILGACAALLALCVSAEEMLSNPLLEPNEAGTAPRDWEFVAWGTESLPLYDPTGGRNGTAAAGVESPTTQDRGCWMETVPLEGRQHLHVSAWYRTEDIDRSNAIKIRVEWWDADRTFLQGTRLWMPPADEWTYFEQVVTAPEGAAFVAPELFNRFGSGRVWWDSAHLREARIDELLSFDDTPAGDGEWGFRPAQGEVTAETPPSFVWRPQHAAISYQLQVARDEACEQIAYETTVPEYTAYRPPTVLEPGAYHWRVRFVDAEERESAWSAVRSFTIPADAAHFPLPSREELFAQVPEGHPRLFIRPEELPWLRELAQGPLQDRYEELVARCEALLESPPPTEDYPTYPEGVQRLDPEWARIWRGARSYVERPVNAIATLALVWHISGNAEYGQAARRMLMEIAEWDPVGATGYRYNDEAGMRYAYGFSRAYTLVHELLTEEEREKCREVMLIRGREMYQHMHTQRQHLWNPYSSHPNRAYHWLGEIGIAFLGEIEEAEEWAWFATNIFVHVYPVWSDDDGGWHEGVHYWHGYLTRITLWLDVMRAAFDLDGYRKPFFSQVGYLPIYAQPPNAPRLTFGDTTGVRTAQNVRPVMTQFVQQTGNPYWADYLSLVGGLVDQRDWIGFIRAARELERPPIEARSIGDLPTARLFEGTGLAYLNTDLTTALDNVMVAFKSSPFGSASHGNEAQNSFELHAYGDALLVRSGTREIHGSPHHRDWTWETHSTNAITVNGEGQVPHTWAARGKIAEFFTTDGFDYAVGDASEAYPHGLITRADRHILFLKPDLVVIYDDLEAPEPATFQYYLHSPYVFEQLAGEQEFDVSGGSGRSRINLIAPADLQITLFEGFDPPPRAPYDEQIHEYHLKAETLDPTYRQQFIALLLPTRADTEPPASADHQQTPGGHALRVTLPEGEAVVLIRTGPGELSGWGLSADGQVAAARFERDGQLIEVFRTNSGAVRWRGEIVTP